MQPSIYIGRAAKRPGAGSDERSRATRYGARVRKRRAGRRASKTPRTRSLGTSVGKLGKWLPDLNDEFDLIEEGEF